jgi:hypothetical protein
VTRPKRDRIVSLVADDGTLYNFTEGLTFRFIGPLATLTCADFDASFVCCEECHVLADDDLHVVEPPGVSRIQALVCCNWVAASRSEWARALRLHRSHQRGSAK